MRTTLPCCTLAVLAACGGGAPPRAVAPVDASGPYDPDLALDRACRGSAGSLRALLPAQVKELVLLWPRVGTRQAEGRCVDVTRVTVVTHQGVLVTLSLERDSGAPRPERGFQDRIDDPSPRAELDRVPDPETPTVHLVVSGPPSMDEDQLGAVLEFLDGVALARAAGGRG